MLNEASVCIGFGPCSDDATGTCTMGRQQIKAKERNILLSKAEELGKICTNGAADLCYRTAMQLFFNSDDLSSDMDILSPGSSVMKDCPLLPGIFEATITYPVKQLQPCCSCLASCLSFPLFISDMQTDAHTNSTTLS